MREMNAVKPLVSVVIPVYNVEEYLDASVQSVREQTYRNLEIILIDDGSTDGSGQICDALAKVDARIRTIHKQNEGLAEARNVGIRQATGRYLCFLDSDDLLMPCAIQWMVDGCEENHADLAIAKITEFAGDNVAFPAPKGSWEALSRTEAIRRMLLHEGGIEHSACAKLYRRELWENFGFPKGLLYEDYATIYRITAKCSTVAVLDAPLYAYRVRNNSIMHSEIREKNLILLDISDETTRFIRDEIPELSNEAEYLQLVTYLKLMKGILNGGFQKYPEAQARILRFVRMHRTLVFQPWAKTADRVKAETLLINRRLFYWVYELGERKNRAQIGNKR